MARNLGGSRTSDKQCPAPVVAQFEILVGEATDEPAREDARPTKLTRYPRGTTESEITAITGAA